MIQQIHTLRQTNPFYQAYPLGIPRTWLWDQDQAAIPAVTLVAPETDNPFRDGDGNGVSHNVSFAISSRSGP